MSDSRIYIPNRIYFRIGDVAEILRVKPYVIRFWESEFPFLAPDKATSGQRVYRRSQIESLILVKHLLHVERYSIEGAKKKLTELRKQAKLKEAMLSLVRTDEDAPLAGNAANATLGTEKAPAVAVGSTVDKNQIDALKSKLEDLQKFIREPAQQGIEVRGLKKLD
ncbi:MAG: MerR family transcriptional regulator [Bdellovibrionales bacterium]|nr:MerR family transcriptional regulator [Bdellovibrionales bacterium]